MQLVRSAEHCCLITRLSQSLHCSLLESTTGLTWYWKRTTSSLDWNRFRLSKGSYNFVCADHSSLHFMLNERRSKVWILYKQRSKTIFFKILIRVPCIFYYFVLWPANAQLVRKLSHSHMFRHQRIILMELVTNIFPSYTSISSAAVGNTVE